MKVLEFGVVQGKWFRVFKVQVSVISDPQYLEWGIGAYCPFGILV